MNKETENLIKALESGITCEKGEVQTNEDGIVYRHDNFKNKFKHTPYWLRRVFEKAAKAAGKEHSSQFHDSGYSFHFNRSPYIGKKDGNIVYSKFIKL